MRLDPLVVDFDSDVAIEAFKIRHLRIRKAGAEFFRLLVHVNNELRAFNAFWKAGKILHERRGGKLSAGLPSLEDERAQFCARSINRGGQSSATAPDNDHFFHRRESSTALPRKKRRLVCAMPELAEVEFFRKQWDCGLGQKILAVRLHPRKRIFRGTNARELARQLTGQRFQGSRAQGKQMLFEFSGGNPETIGARENIRSWLGLHLGMSGKLRMEPADFRPEKHDHLVLQQENQSLVFRDPRLFGRVRFHHGKELPAWWESRVPPIDSTDFNDVFVNGFLKRHARAPIKAVLLLQSGFAGIGNWMADEILWRAKIAPSKSAGSLSPTRRTRLLQETRYVARESLRIIGHDFADPPSDWFIHQKWKREGRCPRHGSVLRKEIIGGRTTAWCPRCQR